MIGVGRVGADERRPEDRTGRIARVDDRLQRDVRARGEPGRKVAEATRDDLAGEHACAAAGTDDRDQTRWHLAGGHDVREQPTARCSRRAGGTSRWLRR